jgi:hypothetical protein
MWKINMDFQLIGDNNSLRMWQFIGAEDATTGQSWARGLSILERLVRFYTYILVWKGYLCVLGYGFAVIGQFL